MVVRGETVCGPTISRPLRPSSCGEVDSNPRTPLDFTEYSSALTARHPLPSNSYRAFKKARMISIPVAPCIRPAAAGGALADRERRGSSRQLLLPCALGGLVR